MARLTAIRGLDVHAYQRSPLHASDCLWTEKNCYADVWIEFLHALGMEPRAMLPFTAAIDFIGDQWVFFKPVHEELRSLYGIEVNELNVWRPLIDHVVEHLSAGRLISTEADAFWLPDTAGTDYRRQHTKSTIIIAQIDVETSTLGYFHNAGYFELSGEDFDRTFHIGETLPPEYMALFAEVFSIDPEARLQGADLRRESRALWTRHLGRLPRSNPVGRFRERLERDLSDIQARGLPYYHAWAFANTRQLGAAYELAGAALDWTSAGEAREAADAFRTVASECKTLILKLARSVATRKIPDLDAYFSTVDKARSAALSGASAWLKGVESPRAAHH